MKKRRQRKNHNQKFPEFDRLSERESPTSFVGSTAAAIGFGLPHSPVAEAPASGHFYDHAVSRPASHAANDAAGGTPVRIKPVELIGLPTLPVANLHSRDNFN